jgi:hypothetical protein
MKMKVGRIAPDKPAKTHPVYMRHLSLLSANSKISEKEAVVAVFFAAYPSCFNFMSICLRR